MNRLLFSLPCALMLGICSLSLFSTTALAQGGVVITPIDPIIEVDRAGTSLWIDNRNDTSYVIQIRVFAWEQKDGEDHYSDQSRIIPSPPIVRIPPKTNQLIRLPHIARPKSGNEATYRVIIDEIPAADVASEEGVGKIGVTIQIRYSIPLIVYSDPNQKALRKSPPVMACRWTHHEGKPVVEVSNLGGAFFKMVDLQLRQPGADAAIDVSGIHYVLAGSMKRITLPSEPKAGAILSAKVRAGEEPVALPECSRGAQKV